jgi:hypothetical protein
MVRHDQAGAVRAEPVAVERLEAEAGGHRPEEAVAIIEVIAPFLVTEQVRPRHLDLDDHQLPLGTDRHHVGAAAVGQRHFAQGEKVGPEEQTCHAAGDVLRGKRHVGKAGVGARFALGGHWPTLE